MRIREAQLETFRDGARRDFEDKTILHLRSHLAEQTLPFSDVLLRARVRACIPRANRYGFRSSKQIVCFVDTTYFLGEFFDSQPTNRDIIGLISDTSVNADLRAGLMLRMAAHRHRILQGEGAVDA
jgi:hypothetical protein